MSFFIGWKDSRQWLSVELACVVREMEPGSSYWMRLYPDSYGDLLSEVCP